MKIIDAFVLIVLVISFWAFGNFALSMLGLESNMIVAIFIGVFSFAVLLVLFLFMIWAYFKYQERISKWKTK